MPPRLGNLADARARRKYGDMQAQPQPPAGLPSTYWPGLLGLPVLSMLERQKYRYLGYRRGSVG